MPGIDLISARHSPSIPMITVVAILLEAAASSETSQNQANSQPNSAESELISSHPRAAGDQATSAPERKDAIQNTLVCTQQIYRNLQTIVVCSRLDNLMMTNIIQNVTFPNTFQTNAFFIQAQNLKSVNIGVTVLQSGSAQQSIFLINTAYNMSVINSTLNLTVMNGTTYQSVALAAEQNGPTFVLTSLLYTSGLANMQATGLITILSFDFTIHGSQVTTKLQTNSSKSIASGLFLSIVTQYLIVNLSKTDVNVTLKTAGIQGGGLVGQVLAPYVVMYSINTSLTCIINSSQVVNNIGGLVGYVKYQVSFFSTKTEFCYGGNFVPQPCENQSMCSFKSTGGIQLLMSQGVCVVSCQGAGAKPLLGYTCNTTCPFYLNATDGQKYCVASCGGAYPIKGKWNNTSRVQCFATPSGCANSTPYSQNNVCVAACTLPFATPAYVAGMANQSMTCDNMCTYFVNTTNKQPTCVTACPSDYPISYIVRGRTQCLTSPSNCTAYKLSYTQDNVCVSTCTGQYAYPISPQMACDPLCTFFQNSSSASYCIPTCSGNYPVSYTLQYQTCQQGNKSSNCSNVQTSRTLCLASAVWCENYSMYAQNNVCTPDCSGIYAIPLSGDVCDNQCKFYEDENNNLRCISICQNNYPIERPVPGSGRIECVEMASNCTEDNYSYSQAGVCVNICNGNYSVPIQGYICFANCTFYMLPNGTSYCVNSCSAALGGTYPYIARNGSRVQCLQSGTNCAQFQPFVMVQGYFCVQTCNSSMQYAVPNDGSNVCNNTCPFIYQYLNNYCVSACTGNNSITLQIGSRIQCLTNATQCNSSANATAAGMIYAQNGTCVATCTGSYAVPLTNNTCDSACTFYISGTTKMCTNCSGTYPITLQMSGQPAQCVQTAANCSSASNGTKPFMQNNSCVTACNGSYATPLTGATCDNSICNYFFNSTSNNYYCVSACPTNTVPMNVSSSRLYCMNATEVCPFSQILAPSPQSVNIASFINTNATFSYFSSGTASSNNYNLSSISFAQNFAVNVTNTYFTLFVNYSTIYMTQIVGILTPQLNFMMSLFTQNTTNLTLACIVINFTQVNIMLGSGQLNLFSNVTTNSTFNKITINTVFNYSSAGQIVGLTNITAGNSKFTINNLSWTGTVYSGAQYCSLLLNQVSTNASVMFSNITINLTTYSVYHHSSLIANNVSSALLNFTNMSITIGNSTSLSQIQTTSPMQQFGGSYSSTNYYIQGCTFNVNLQFINQNNTQTGILAGYLTSTWITISQVSITTKMAFMSQCSASGIIGYMQIYTSTPASTILGLVVVASISSSGASDNEIGFIGQLYSDTNFSIQSSNITVNVTMQVCTSSGGIIGQVLANNNYQAVSLNLSYSYFTTNIYGGVNLGVIGDWYITTYQTSTAIMIQQCTFSARVNGSSNVSYSQIGAVGYLGATQSNSPITLTVANTAFAGGLMGTGTQVGQFGMIYASSGGSNLTIYMTNAIFNGSINATAAYFGSIAYVYTPAILQFTLMSCTFTSSAIYSGNNQSYFGAVGYIYGGQSGLLVNIQLCTFNQTHAGYNYGGAAGWIQGTSYSGNTASMINCTINSTLKCYQYSGPAMGYIQYVTATVQQVAINTSIIAMQQTYIAGVVGYATYTVLAVRSCSVNVTQTNVSTTFAAVVFQNQYNTTVTNSTFNAFSTSCCIYNAAGTCNPGIAPASLNNTGKCPTAGSCT